MSIKDRFGLTDFEINDWIATELMGWHKSDDKLCYVINGLNTDVKKFDFCADINQAFNVIKKMADTGHGCQMFFDLRIWICEFLHMKTRSRVDSAHRNPCRAICEAAWFMYNKKGVVK